MRMSLSRLSLIMTFLITLLAPGAQLAAAAPASGGASERTPTLARAESPRPALADGPKLTVSQTVSQEPLLGGAIGYTLTITNSGATPVTDRGYNLTISDTLPVGLTYISASQTPSLVAVQSNGTTQLYWDNIVDLEAGESISISISASLGSSLTTVSSLANQVSAQVNSMPDNSGSWIRASNQISASPQAIDISLAALQSTAAAQASGAGEYPADAPGRGAGADWPYQYKVTVKNNKVGSSSNVVATITLPAGVAYLGSPAISPNPNSSSATPALTLRADGSLDMSWSLGTLTTAQYTNPVVITFSAAIPYRYRATKDQAASKGPFAGPMSGAVIPEDEVLPVSYEATALYSGTASADGTQSTPNDDRPAKVTVDYLTASKSASPTVVGIGTDVTFTLKWYVSEYYTTTDVVLTDVLPDGMTYVDNSASLAPASVQTDTPSAGRTTITWQIPDASTTAGKSGTITLHATVDPTYSAAPNAGQPLVSGDTLTNQVSNAGNWQDVVAPPHAGALTPETVKSSVSTRMPSFSKEVRNPQTSAWSHSANAFTGDTLSFRLTYAAAADIDAKGIIIRDFLPRGMSYVNGSANHTSAGSFSDGISCTSQPSTPTIGTLNGLQYLEWHLCNTAKGSTWQASIDASIGDIPNIQPNWIVANFGKLTGQNTPGQIYSLRDIANINYFAPTLTLTKSANPSTNLVGGQTTTFTISIKNTGKATAYNLRLVDKLPANLIVANSGGSASPSVSSYATDSGNPSAGTGGVVSWSPVSSLAVGATQTFVYNATIPNGLPAGAQMTNLASVSYNSRADGTGHQWNTSTSTSDSNTKSATVYVRGLSVTKTASVSSATIGETVRWTITGVVPAGVVGYWPVVQENSLPQGFAYITNTTVLSGAQLDSAAGHHPKNPLGDGDRELRWFLQTLDNSASAQPYTFTLKFDTLVTGFKGGSPSTLYYTNNCCLNTASNSVYIGWYDTTSGYNNKGYADDSTATNRTTRRSPAGTASVTIRQPFISLSSQADHTLIGANDTVLLTLRSSNIGNSTAYDVVLTDTLPSGLKLLETKGMSISYPAGFPNVTTVMTNSSTVGSTQMSYALDRLYVGATWIITATASVDPAIAAGLTLNNSASINRYSSRPGNAPDSNGDGQPDERSYTGPKSSLALTTPAPTLQKSAGLDGDLNFGSTLVYTLTVPATPINATVYSLAITDTIDSRLQISSVSGATQSGSRVSAGFASIPPGQQRTIVISTLLPSNSSAKDGDVINNQAAFSYAGHAQQLSNLVAETVATPALVVDKSTTTLTIAANDLINYTISIANVGSGRATDLVVQDQMPANMAYVSGSGKLNGQALANPSNNAWSLPDLSGHLTHTLTFQARAASAAAGQAYINTASATGSDSHGQPILSDNHARVPADTDADDQDSTPVYGPLTWKQSSSFVAYEDLKKNGWSDWDYNDFVVRIDISQGLTGDGMLAALKINYTALSRGAGFDHQFMHTLPLDGGGRVALIVRNASGQTLVQRNSTFSNSATFAIFDRTKQALPPPSGSPYTNTPSTQTSYIPGYTAELNVVLNDAELNEADLLPPLPWDPYISVYNTKQAVHLVIPGFLDNTQVVNGAYDPGSPLLGYDLPLAQVFEPTWRWPIEFIGIWHAYPQYAKYIDSGGTTNQDWATAANANLKWIWSHLPSMSGVRPISPSDSTPASRYFAGPTVADLNGDGSKEIILPNLLANRVEVYDAQRKPLAGWPQAVGGGVKASAAVADLNGDRKPDILAGAEDGKLYAWNSNGTPLAGWPVQVGKMRLLATPAIADIDGDKKLDVIIPLSDGKLYAFNANGTPKSGWPVSIGDVQDQYGSQIINSSPRIADLDGSGKLKIIVGSADHKVYAFNANGTLAWSYLTGDMILGAPAVADFDPSRPGLETVVGSGDSYVYLLDKDGHEIWHRRTGWTIRSTPLAADLNGDGTPELLVSGDDKRMWAWYGNGSKVSGWPKTTGAPLFSSPTSGDLDGDSKPEIVVGSDDAHIYAWHTDGSSVAGWPRATSAAVKGTPVVAALKPGDKPSVIIGDFSGKIFFSLEAIYHVLLPAISR